jgi:hypothetical protein
MTRPLVSISIDGENRAIEALVGVSRDAELAQRSALRAAGRRARSLTVKALAAHFGIPQKVFRHRLQYFNRVSKRSGVRRAVLWLGTQRRPRASEDRRIAAAIQRQQPRARWATWPNGRRSLVVDEGGRARTAELELEEVARGFLESKGREAMRERYSETLARDFNRRLERRARRSRR